MKVRLQLDVLLDSLPCFFAMIHTDAGLGKKGKSNIFFGILGRLIGQAGREHMRIPVRYEIQMKKKSLVKK